jgi:hypothetical protein
MISYNTILSNPFIDWDREPDLDGLRLAYNKLQTDNDGALKELRELADQGSVMSMIYIGDDYYSRRGQIGNILKAREWYGLASENGSLIAEYKIGRLYYNDDHFNSALFHFNKIIDDGPSGSLHIVGHMYQHGKGVDRDLETAKRYFELGAAKGHVYAKRDLSRFLMSGRYGIPNIIRGLLLWLSCVTDIVTLVWTENEGDKLS